MLLTLLSLLSADADACSPGMAVYLDSVPDSGLLEVPVDAVLKIELSSGYLYDVPDISLQQDGVKLAVDIAVHKRTIDLIEEHIVLEVTPLDELEPNLEYVLEIADPDTGELEPISVFVVGEQRAEEVTLVPTLSWIEHDFIELSEEDMTSCDYSNRTELHFDLSSGEEMIDHSIHLYRVPANLVHSGSVITDEDLEDRFHTVLRHEEYASLSTKISDTSVAEEYCFVARYSNAAGQEGPISAAVCSMNYDPMQWECGTGMGPIGWFGCSNIGTSTASLFTMIMSVFGLVRRRKK